MTRNVFILGAGASREGGAPLMFDFLDTARDLARTDCVDDARDEFETVFKAVSALQRVHSKSQLDMNNIEAVFTALEMAQMIGSLPGHTPAELDRLLPAMRVVIKRTLEEKLNFARSVDLRDPPPPYYQFADLIMHLRTVSPKQDSCVITFNYDLAVDFAVHRHGLAVDYALETEPTQAYPVLKLHGSLNWFNCRTCDRIVPWDLAPFAQKLPAYDMNHSWLPIKLSAAGSVHAKTHGHTVAPEPVLVPPTWSKAEYHRTLAAVWRRAAHELRNAENIFIVGYSLPSTDEFFRYLYSLGTVGETVLRRFWVFDPDPSGSVETRFRALLGPGAEQRFWFMKAKFSAGIEVIKSEFKDRQPRA